MKKKIRDSGLLTGEDPDRLQQLKDCLKMYRLSNPRPPTQLVGQEHLQVRLGKSKVVSNGLFKKSTFRVAVATSPMDWGVLRTYDDFKWLHAALEARFPASFLVELPRIELAEAKKDADEYYLGAYLNSLVCSRDFLHSPELEEFLRLNEKEFSKAKEVAARCNEENRQSLLQAAQRHTGLQPGQARLEVRNSQRTGRAGHEPRD